MPSVNLRQLRDTRQIKEWLKQGKVIELRERDRVLGHITPEPAAGHQPPKEMPDFAARRKRIFGDKVIPIVEDLINERNTRY
jgi:hypothetical protein